MSSLPKRWIEPSSSPGEDQLQRFRALGLRDLAARILWNRGFDDPQIAADFLNAETYASQPFNRSTQLKDLVKAVERLIRAIEQREQIVVYGDFDADGVTSTVLMVSVLRELYRRRHRGVPDAEVEQAVKPYIPNRVDEGYGLNNQALNTLASTGARVVVTVDCGIRSVDEVRAGRDAGLDMIVTDHHSVGPELPEALAVINPKQATCPYPEKMLAGVGVAYRVAEALAVVATHKKWSQGEPPLDLESYLDLVAIGTVADLAPLNSAENRALVKRGLDVLNRAQRPGLKALLAVAGVEPGTVTATTIGYAIGPRINAAGRLDDAMVAYELLSAPDEATAVTRANTLQELNVLRQELTRAAQLAVREEVEPQSFSGHMIFASGQFKPGIVGLVAGRLTEEFYRPTVIMERGTHESRASCRSIPQFDITQALDACAELLVRHGGHAQAAGFTVVNENIPQLKERLISIAQEQLAGQDLKPLLDIDAVVNLNHLTLDMVEELKQLEPTGFKNPTPVLMARSVHIKEKRTVGKDNQHLKLKLTRAGQPPLDAIGFNLGDWVKNPAVVVDLAFELEINEWNGQRTLQLNLRDLRPAGER